MSKDDKDYGVIHKLKNVRLSFPQIFKPKAFEAGKEPRFQAAFLFDPSDSDHKKAIKAILADAKAMVREEWGKDIQSDEYRRCFGLADNHPKKRKYEGYEGMWYIDTSNTIAPTLIDRRKNEVVEADGVLYAGCYVNTNVSLWLYDHPKGGKGIGANLRIIQFYRDGESFSMARASADEMDEVDIEDDDDTVDAWDDDDLE